MDRRTVLDRLHQTNNTFMTLNCDQYEMRIVLTVPQAVLDPAIFLHPKILTAPIAIQKIYQNEHAGGRRIVHFLSFF